MTSSFICSRSNVSRTSSILALSMLSHSSTREDLPRLTRKRVSSTFIAALLRFAKLAQGHSVFALTPAPLPILGGPDGYPVPLPAPPRDRKSTRLNSSHTVI